MRIKLKDTNTLSKKDICKNLGEKFGLTTEKVIELLKLYETRLYSINIPAIQFNNILLEEKTNIAIIITEDNPDEFLLRQELLNLDDVIILDVRRWFENQEDLRIVNLKKLSIMNSEHLRNKILVIYPVLNIQEYKRFLAINFHLFRNIIYIDYLIKYYNMESTSFISTIANEYFYKSNVNAIYKWDINLTKLKGESDD